MCRRLEVKPRWDESVPMRKGPADKTVALYDRAARYRRLLECVADRILGDSEKAIVAVENCLRSAASESAPDCEGAFRGWLVRLAIDGACAILHGTSVPESQSKDKHARLRRTAARRGLLASFEMTPAACRCTE